MTIFLTGASGLVGSAFARLAAARGHHVIGIVGEFPGAIPGVSEKRALNLADEAVVTTAILDLYPQAIVNCAAISQPEVCDAHPSVAQTMNVALPALLARLARHVNARLVHLSSEQAFDGQKSTPYKRDDPTSPINLYARQKIESERLVHSAAADEAVTLRAPLLMGHGLTGKRSLHERLLLDWAAGKTAKLYTDEFRQVCTSENLAAAMVELVERPEICGVHHWAGTDLLSRYEIGQRVREHFKLSAAQAPLAAVTRAENPEAARKRQACLALDLDPLPKLLRTQPQSFAAQLAELRVPAGVQAWHAAATGS